MFTKTTKVEADDLSLEGILEPGDVLLLASPFSRIAAPLLGIHLLQASCQAAGIKTGVLYSNLLYSYIIGADLHKVISCDDDERYLLGERIFTAAAFNMPSLSISRTMHKFSDPEWAPDHVWKVKKNQENTQVPEPVVHFREWLGTLDLEYLESLTSDWVNALTRQIVDIGFRIVGCSTTFGGIVQAIALLNSIKKIDPDVITIMGGALCEETMGEGILSLNAGIDYIFSGEGEITFPALVKQILEGCLPGKKIIYGQDIIDLDSIPVPDYQDYVKQREKFYVSRLLSSSKTALTLPFETSRGCNFAKCTFCSFNGKRNVFRSKSPDIIIQSLKALSEQHQTDSIYMCDNMMPPLYFDTLLPRLPTEVPSAEILYHIRTDLTLGQVLSLKRAGIKRIQPGIESLSPSLLKRINKPFTVRENIALLRYTRSVGIYPVWFLLFGIPGDQTCEYEEMLHLFPLIRHLQPPNGMWPLRLCRFSKYQIQPNKFGITNLRPAEVYKDILPPYSDVDKLAYYFAADFPSQSRGNPAAISALWKECQAWSKAWAAYETIPLDILLPTFHVTRKTLDRYVLEDTRGLPGRPRQMEINREQASLLLVARPLETASEVNIRWAVDAGLGVAMEPWFIPLATAEPTLLQEFECDYEQAV
jgi:ribosomal peptide maturation radical SAM protein 1